MKTRPQDPVCPAIFPDRSACLGAVEDGCRLEVEAISPEPDFLIGTLPEQEIAAFAAGFRDVADNVNPDGSCNQDYSGLSNLDPVSEVMMSDAREPVREKG